MSNDATHVYKLSLLYVIKVVLECAEINYFSHGRKWWNKRQRANSVSSNDVVTLQLKGKKDINGHN